MQFECPICQKPAAKPTLGRVCFFPFCSERCRMVDLGKWLDSDYRVAVTADEPEEKDIPEALSEI
jgi:endogenous inhibitor of DNA gyrase (YacG/DUF329 family)